MKHKSIPCSECSSCGKSVFCHSSTEDLSDISKNKVMNAYKRGQNLFTQGNPASGVFCVSSGRIKVSKIGPNGKESIVRLAGPGDIVGNSGFTDNQFYSSTATVLEDARICYLDNKYMSYQFSRNPSVALNMLSKLGHEMQLLELRQFALTNKTAKARIADLLVYLSQSYFQKEHNRIRIDIRLSRDDMASITGTAQETVIRQITEFKQLGIIEQEGKTLFILDQQKLAEMCL